APKQSWSDRGKENGPCWTAARNATYVSGSKVIWQQAKARLCIHACEALELGDHAVELLDQRIRAGGAKRLHQGAIIPEHSTLATREPAPHRLADLAVIGEDFPRVVQLIGGRDQPHIRRGVR